MMVSLIVGYEMVGLANVFVVEEPFTRWTL